MTAQAPSSNDVDSNDVPPGTVVGEYEIRHKLGAGSYGDVYAAEHPTIGKQAAVKVLHRKFSSEKDVVSRFTQEARAVNKIRHRNIIDIFSIGRMNDGRHYLIMELLHGRTLGDVLVVDGPLPLDRAIPILRGVADALDAAHGEGIAHRDLKPDNVFVVEEKDGSTLAKLLDFGVAKLSGDELVAHKTSTGVAVGTPLYMAPEQCRGKNVDHRADIYSFGILIYEVLSGKVPIDGETAMDVLYKHMGEPPTPFSSWGGPASLDAPFEQILAKRASKRPQSAGAALQLIIDAATSAGLLAPDQIGKRLTGQFAPEDDDVSVPARTGEGGLKSTIPTKPGDKTAVELQGGERGTARSGTVMMDDPNLPQSAGLATSGPRNAASAGVGGPTSTAGAPPTMHSAGEVTPPSSLGGSAQSAAGGRSLAPLILVAILSVAGVAGYLIATRTAEPEVVAQPEPKEEPVAEPAPEPEPVVEPAGTSEPAADVIQITVVSNPRGAEVYLGDTLLGHAGHTLDVDKGDKLVEITLRKDGYQDGVVKITPSKSREVRLTLDRLPAGAPPPVIAAPPPTVKPKEPPPPSGSSLDDLLGNRD